MLVKELRSLLSARSALAILSVVERHSKQCFIGRDSGRPDRKRYIMTYWE